MASVDSLPPDQRAVLQLVLQRGRSYDDIAKLLSIDRTAVRQRALSGLESLGPRTRVDPERRALITDYLLGQLPPAVRDNARDVLATWPRERAWARVVASELASLGAGHLPEIPNEAATQASEPAESTQPTLEEEPDAGASTATDTDETTGTDAGASTAADSGAMPVKRDSIREKRRERRRRKQERKDEPKRDEPKPEQVPAAPEPSGERRTSRLGGAVLIGIGVVIAIVVVVIVIASGGNKKDKPPAATTPATSTSTSSTSTSTSTPTTTTATRVVAQINLLPPSGAGKPAGVAQVVKQGASSGIIIVASSVAANTKHNAYAVWLFKPPSTSKLLGFVNPGVGTNGRLQTAGGLPANASSYSELLVTLETQASPKSPGTIIMQGKLQLG